MTWSHAPGFLFPAKLQQLHKAIFDRVLLSPLPTRLTLLCFSRLADICQQCLDKQLEQACKLSWSQVYTAQLGVYCFSERRA